MKKLKQYFSIIDDEGVGVPGKEVWFYPIGTTNHGTKADGVTGKPGQYEIEIDPSSDNAKISHYYDVWYDGVKQYSKVTLKDKWMWFTNILMDNVIKEVFFSTLLDENGEALPTAIPNAIVGIMSMDKGRFFYITSSSSAGIWVHAQDFADDNCTKLTTNSVTINVFVTVKAITT